MKTRHFLIALCLLSAGMGFAQNQLFEKYADMDNVTSVYISKAMFRMMPNIEDAGVNLSNLKDKIESLQLVTTENQDMTAQMKREFSGLVANRHEALMRFREGKSTRIDFYSYMEGERIKELVMLVDAEDNFTAILLTGNFTLQDIQGIAEQN